MAIKQLNNLDFGTAIEQLTETHNNITTLAP